MAPLTTVLVAAGLAASVTPAQAAVTYTARPGDNLTHLFERLQPGDTLVLQPGTYDVPYLRPKTRRGTATAPITVRAADSRNRPLIRGTIKVFDIDYWRINNIRVQAVKPGFEALYIGGGKNWVVSGSEFFGARATNGYSNVTIAGSPLDPYAFPIKAPVSSKSPSGFRFAYNCVHDAAASGRYYTDHNIYVSFPGRSGTGGRIERNVIFRHPNGVGVKLGDGGSSTALGPWGVNVSQNTIIDGGRQILLSGDVRYNTVNGNILAASKQPFTTSTKTAHIYAYKVPTRTNSAANNYFWAAHMAWYSPDGSLTIKTGNRWGPKPGFTLQNSCSATAYQTTVTDAVRYGRHGTGAF